MAKQKPCNPLINKAFYVRRGTGTRTRGLQLPKLARYRTALHPEQIECKYSIFFAMLSRRKIIYFTTDSNIEGIRVEKSRSSPVTGCLICNL